MNTGIVTTIKTDIKVLAMSSSDQVICSSLLLMLEDGSWKLGTGNWELEAGSWNSELFSVFYVFSVLVLKPIHTCSVTVVKLYLSSDV